MQSGHFRESAGAWRDAVAECEKAGDYPGEINALSQLAECEERIGDYPAAIAAFTKAINLQPKSNSKKVSSDDPSLNKTSLKVSLAQAYVLARSDSMGMSYLDQAQTMLDQVKDLPDAAQDSRLRAAIYNVYGALFLAKHQPLDAAHAYQTALDLAQADSNKTAIAQAAANAALAYLAEARSARRDSEAGNTSSAPKRIAKAIPQGKNLNTTAWDAAASGNLPPSPTSGFLFLTIGQTDEGFAGEEHPDAPPQVQMRAFAAYEQARKIADATNDSLIQSYALGYIGHLYEISGRKVEAQQLTHQAQFIAQNLQMPDPLYLWQWQSARLLRTEDRDAAIAAYNGAVASLQSIQTDLSVGGGNSAGGVSFRQAAGKVYYELADLLLQKAPDDAQSALQQIELAQARDTIENLKTVELENYFQERCQKMVEQRSVDIATIDPQTAIVYFVPLDDRIEILVGLSDPPKNSSDKNIPYILRTRAPVGITAQKLDEVARNFRRKVRDPSGSYEYVADGRTLNQWLISPVEELLTKKQKKIDTMVFVLDGVLRSVPMCALVEPATSADDSAPLKYLCEKYAIAISPGMHLTQPRQEAKTEALSSTNTRLLINGLSKSVQNFPELPNVRQEVKDINAGFNGNGVTLLDEQFLYSSVDKQMQDNPYSIVHIASHGSFGSDPRDTYVLAYDKQMNLDDLEKMIEPGKFRDHPVDLLTLSACDTAAGDDRAALGLAGIAVKAGALSALATLWSIPDKSTSIIIPDFYKHLREPKTSKAKALQEAQLKLMKTPGFDLPYSWSPFLIVGNWQ